MAKPFETTQAALIPSLDSMPALRTGSRASHGESTKVDLTYLTDREGNSFEFQHRRRDYFDSIGGRFMVIFFEMHTAMREHRIGLEARVIMDWFYPHLAKSSEAGNIVSGITQKMISAGTGIAQPNVSRALSKLAQHGFVVRGGLGQFIFNPRYCWYGPASKQRAAAKKWDQRVADMRRAEMVADAARPKQGAA